MVLLQDKNESVMGRPSRQSNLYKQSFFFSSDPRPVVLVKKESQLSVAVYKPAYERPGFSLHVICPQIRPFGGLGGGLPGDSSLAGTPESGPLKTAHARHYPPGTPYIVARPRRRTCLYFNTTMDDCSPFPAVISIGTSSSSHLSRPNQCPL